MKGENNNNFKRPDFLKDRIKVNPFQPPRPGYIDARQIQPKPVEEVKTKEGDNDDNV